MYSRQNPAPALTSQRRPPAGGAQQAACAPAPPAIAGHTRECGPHPKPAAVHPEQSLPSPLYPFQSLLGAVNARQGRSCHAAQAPFILAGHAKGSQVPATLLPRKAGAQSVVPSAQPSSALPQLKSAWPRLPALLHGPSAGSPVLRQHAAQRQSPTKQVNTDGAASCRRPRPQPQMRP